ncbi:hypothetical protein EIP91_010702 [Steccherinum ochraceum]|uniref:FAD-binding PCMH-type domain-containing protein n=1 Tax=Steccherinum ochraceum TaxID=92696 RepID=A0A4R0RCC2_9APHY|nr:hypothetical protein EIP91_010702 [Steccherinum ochraceum]
MSDFASFKKSFSGELVTANDPGYEAAIARWAKNSVKRARVVAFVKNSQDVAAALKYAKAAGLRVAIRGGGHNPAAASSSEDGLVIDLSKLLNKVTVDADKKLAYVGGGALWRDVDEATIKHGLVTVAGTVNHTGVGGLTLGGGYGFLTGLHGLAIDNLAGATVVVADGRILKVSSTENPDLFYGIRGGGSNFGVVTEFIFRLHPHPRKVFAGIVMFTPDKLQPLTKALDAWWANIKPQEAIYTVFGRAPPNHDPMILALVVYHGTEAEGRASFKPILDVGVAVDMATEIPYENLNGILNAFSDHGANYFMKGTVLDKKPSLEMTQEMFDKVMSLSKVGEMSAMIAFEYVSHAKVHKVSPDETPYNRTLPGNGIIIIKWEDDDPKKYKIARDAAHAIADLTPKGEAYGNYAGPDSDGLPKEGAVPADRSQIFFKKAYPKLQVIKKKYDPELVFNKWYPIQPSPSSVL